MRPNFDILLLTVLYAVTFLILLPSVCKNLGFSKYFDPSNADKATIDRENDMRMKIANRSLANFEKLRRTDDEAAILDFVIVIVSVRRRYNPHYLLQSATRLLSEVLKDRGNSTMFVFNAEENPEHNKDAETLAAYLKVVNRSEFSLPRRNEDVFEKQKLDYLNALRVGLRLRSRYVLIAEDDALASDRILDKLRYVLKWKMPNRWLSTSAASNEWAFLKLYYPEKWQGFGNAEIPELLLIGVLGALSFVAFRGMVQRHYFDRKSRLWLWAACGFSYFVLVAYSVGRAHWIEMRKVWPALYGVGPATAPGCCIPAVLFPSEQAHRLAVFLNRTTCRNGYPLDFAFEDFAGSHGLKGLLVSPNLFTHIGFHSSLHANDKNTKEFRLLFQP